MQNSTFSAQRTCRKFFCQPIKDACVSQKNHIHFCQHQYHPSIHTYETLLLSFSYFFWQHTFTHPHTAHYSIFGSLFNLYFNVMGCRESRTRDGWKVYICVQQTSIRLDSLTQKLFMLFLSFFGVCGWMNICLLDASSLRHIYTVLLFCQCNVNGCRHTWRKNLASAMDMGRFWMWTWGKEFFSFSIF